MPSSQTLGAAEIDHFITHGFVAISGAFSKEDAALARAILWAATGCDPNDRSTWKEPVIRIGHQTAEPFRRLANTPVLHAAFDALVGPGRWLPLGGLGTFPIRFPSDKEPGDDGWHIDVSFAAPGEDASNFFNWRANWRSQGRALLMLFLLSEVGEDDAPTRIRAGSHRDVARQLKPHGEGGLKLLEIDYEATTHLPTTHATGAAGTVYLCHPFLVHAAQRHRGTRPKFMAQPPLLPTAALNLEAGGEHSPVERAILEALT